MFKVISELMERYSEPHRKYHNLSHINSCLHLADTMLPKDADLFSIRTAIWFHDAIYNTTRNDNEEESSYLFRDAAFELDLDQNITDKIAEMILSTKHSNANKYHPIDTKYLLDIDLSILGESEEVFDLYDRNIREEYSWVPIADYKFNREIVLQSFLNKNTIFLTEEFSEYEVPARRNIQRALEKL